MPNITRIKNNQITDSTIEYTKIKPGTLVGSVFNPDLTLNSNVTIVGNLDIQGTTSTVQSTNTYINDPLVIFNNGYTGSPTYDIGILVNRNLASVTGVGNVNAAFVWDESEDKFAAVLTTETGGTAGAINITAYADAEFANIDAVDGTFTGNLSAINFTGNITGDVTGNLTGDVTGNVTGDVTGNLTGNVTGDVTGNLTGNVTGDVTGNLTGNVTGDVTGNVTGDLTGNVTGNVTGDLTGNVTGNVTGDVTGNLTGNVTGDVTGNVTGNLTGDVTGNLTGNVTGDVTGNITGNVTGNIVGDVTANIVTANTVVTSALSVGTNAIDANVPLTITSNVGSTSSSTGALIVTGGAGIGENLYVAGTAVIGGNLTVQGTLTSVQSTTVEIADLNITVAKGAADAAAANGAGLTVDGANATITYNAGSDSWEFNKDLIAAEFTGNVTGNLTGDVTGNVTGDVTGNLTGNVTGNLTGDVTGNLTGDVTGNVTGNLTGDVTGNVTGDVTGNLTGNVTGDVTGNLTGNVTGDVTGNVTGNLTGDVTGNVTGNLTGDVTGNVTGDVTGNLTGNVTGNLTGDVTGNVTGDVTGNLTGNVTGDVTGDLTGNISGNTTVSGTITADALIINAAGTAGQNIIHSGDTTAGLFRSVADATYDQVIIGGDGTAGDLLAGARLNIIGTDSVRIPSGSTGQRPATPSLGMLRYNSTMGTPEIYTGSAWKGLIGDFTVITAETFNGDGIETAFTLGAASTTASTVVAINGVVQIPVTAYSVSGTTLTFTEAPEAGDVIDVRRLLTTSTISGVSSTNSFMQIEPTDSGINFYTGTSSGAITTSIDTGGAFVTKAAATSATTSATTVDSFAKATYRSAKYMIQATSGSDFEVSEVLVIHDGTTATMVEYGNIATNGSLGTITATVSGANVLLQYAAASGTVSVIVKKDYIVV